MKKASEMSWQECIDTLQGTLTLSQKVEVVQQLVMLLDDRDQTLTEGAFQALGNDINRMHYRVSDLNNRLTALERKWGLS